MSLINNEEPPRDHHMINKMHMDNTICELEQFSGFLSEQLLEEKNARGIIIGNHIDSCSVFEFLIKILRKFDPAKVV